MGGDTTAERVVALPGLRVTYLETGGADLPPAIALHSLTSNAAAWNGVAQGLADRRRVLVPDLRGHGGTDHATDYAQDRWVDDVTAFADALGLDRFALLGYTMGSRIAWLCAARHPERVECLVSIDMAPRMPKALPDIGAPSFATIDEAMAAYRTEPVYSPSRDDLFRPFIERNVTRRADGRLVWRYDLTLRAAPASVPGFSATAEEQMAAVRRIVCPTLVVATARNPGVSRLIREEMVPAMRDARLLEIGGDREDILMGRPEALVAAIREFLPDRRTAR